MRSLPGSTSGLSVAVVAVVVLIANLDVTSATVDVSNLRLRKILGTSYNRDRPPTSVHGGDGPITVQLNIHIRELLLNENELTLSVYGVDVVQLWTDPRLAVVTQDSPDLHLYKDSIDDVWTPDLHVVNSRRQTPSADHRSLTVSRAGIVRLQQRLSMDVLCPNFTSHMKPLICAVQLQPYSNTHSEVVYEWGVVTLEPHLTVPKYTLINLETGACTVATSVGSHYSCKQLSLAFRADVNFFATEVYGASFLLVALSWTGFWIDDGTSSRQKNSSPAVRLGLGLVIVLILVVYGVGFRLLHNKVGVPGNVEVWVAFCTLFVLASLVEFVFVHILLCTVPGQLRHVCCKRTAPPCCNNDVTTLPPTSDESASFRKAARVIDVSCGILFPVIFILFNVAYWITY